MGFFCPQQLQSPVDPLDTRRWKNDIDFPPRQYSTVPTNFAGLAWLSITAILAEIRTRLSPS